MCSGVRSSINHSGYLRFRVRPEVDFHHLGCLGTRWLLLGLDSMAHLPICAIRRREMTVQDSIEYELVDWEAREVWHCSVCHRYRHRAVLPGQLPAICCGQPARLWDRYQQPIPITVSEPIGEPLSEYA